MARGRHPARLTMPVLEPAARERYHLFWPSVEIYQNPTQFPLLTAEALFGEPEPLAVDFGCATGHFTNTMAARYPAVRYIGIDHAQKPVANAAFQAWQQGLPNVRFLQAEITLLAPLLVTGSLAFAYLHFPVPVHTTGKRKHHIYGAIVLGHIARALRPGGRLSLMTDDAIVAEEQQQFIASQSVLRALSPEEWHLQLDDELKSPFQRRWEKRGRQIWRVELERR